MKTTAGPAQVAETVYGLLAGILRQGDDGAQECAARLDTAVESGDWQRAILALVAYAESNGDHSDWPSIALRFGLDCARESVDGRGADGRRLKQLADLIEESSWQTAATYASHLSREIKGKSKE